MGKTLWKNRFWGGSASGYRCWLCLLDTQMDWMGRHLDPWVWSSKTGSSWGQKAGELSVGDWDPLGWNEITRVVGHVEKSWALGLLSRENFGDQEDLVEENEKEWWWDRSKTARCDALETNWAKCSKEEEGSSHVQCYVGQALSTRDLIQPRGCPGDFDKSTFCGAMESSLD